MTSKRSSLQSTPTPALGQYGFTLMETLVAMVILSIALVVIFQQFSGALNGAHLSEAYTRAVWHAKEKMDELLLIETPVEDSREGDFGDGYRWRYRIEQINFEDGSNPEGLTNFTISVWVSWDEGRTTKEVDISALTFVKSTNI